MSKLLQDQFTFMVRNVAIPQAINKYIIKKPIFDSYVVTVVVWLGLFFACRIFYYIVLYPVYFSPFRHLPTPKERSWLWGNFPPHFVEPMCMTMRTINESVENDGLIRIYSFLCQECLLVTSPKLLGEVFVKKAYEFTKTSQLKYNATRMIGDGMACSEGDQHKLQRRCFLPAFSTWHIKELYPAFWMKSTELVQCLDRESQTDKVIQMKGWCSKITLDIIGVTGMDHDFQSLQNVESPLIQAYAKLFGPTPKKFRYFAQIGSFISPRIIARLPLKFNKMIEQNSAQVRRETFKIIERKRQRIQAGTDERLDIIGQTLRGDAPFTDDNLVDHMMSFMAAGHETTSTTLQWLLLAMCRHRDMQDRLREEIRSIVPDACFPLDAADLGIAVTPLTVDVVENLPYCKAVCNEALRCYTPAPMTIRVSEYGDSYLDGMFVPRGTKLFVSAQAVNHDPKLWGPDAGVFNPDRWMAPGQSSAGGASSAYAQMSFLHGPHGCIGKDFAKAELYAIATCLFGSFKFRLEDPRLENPEAPLEYAQGITVSPAGGVAMRLERIRAGKRSGVS
ncbi:hypothetical protein NHJ13734_009357 [Beauveria thailandica]